MDRMKTFFKYAIWVILFFIFSEILISVNIESTYRNIGRKDNIEQVNIYQAQATKINGKIKGTITNDSKNKLDKKYLRIDFYSDRDVILGTKYIDIFDIKENDSKEIELYFKLQDVKYYNMSYSDDKEVKEMDLLLKDLTRGQVLLGTFLTFLILW